MKKLILIFSAMLLVISLKAQEPLNPDTTNVYRIETRDGNVFTGRILSEDQQVVSIATDKLGTIRIPIGDIRSRVLLDGVKTEGGEFWMPNPQSTRYFWAPNGYGLQKGEAYYQNIWVFYNQLSWGISNHFSMSAGMIPLFLFAGAPTPIWIVPKFSIPVSENKFNLGTGAFLGTVLGESTGVFGLLFGTATFGSRDKNFSFGLAQGFSTDGWLDVPIINLSGMARTGPRGYFVTENYMVFADGEFGMVISAGGRSIIRNIGLDYSLWIPIIPDMGGFVAAPFLGITVPLGKSRLKVSGK